MKKVKFKIQPSWQKRKVTVEGYSINLPLKGFKFFYRSKYDMFSSTKKIHEITEGKSGFLFAHGETFEDCYMFALLLCQREGIRGTSQAIKRTQKAQNNLNKQ